MDGIISSPVVYTGCLKNLPYLVFFTLYITAWPIGDTRTLPLSYCVGGGITIIVYLFIKAHGTVIESCCLAVLLEVCEKLSQQVGKTRPAHASYSLAFG